MCDAFKPVIPRDVAEAIGRLRNAECSNEEILSAMFAAVYDYGDVSILRLTPFDTLLAALVNGYEVEREPTKRERVDRLLSEFYRYPAAPPTVLDAIERIYSEGGNVV